jgi:hypothetical protein
VKDEKNTRSRTPNHPIWIPPPAGVMNVNVGAGVARDKETSVVIYACGKNRHRRLPGCITCAIGRDY